MDWLAVSGACFTLFGLLALVYVVGVRHNRKMDGDPRSGHH